MIVARLFLVSNDLFHLGCHVIPRVKNSLNYGPWVELLGSVKLSLRASSPSQASLARTRERGAEERRSRETRFTRPNRRACSQAKLNLALVAQTLDSAFHRIIRYPVDNYYQNQMRYPLDSILSVEWPYPPFEQLGPGLYCEPWRHCKNSQIRLFTSLVCSFLNLKRKTRQERTPWPRLGIRKILWNNFTHMTTKYSEFFFSTNSLSGREQARIFMDTLGARKK